MTLIIAQDTESLEEISLDTHHGKPVVIHINGIERLSPEMQKRLFEIMQRTPANFVFTAWDTRAKPIIRELSNNLKEIRLET